MKNLLREIKYDPALQLQLLVTGMHLSPEFGFTYQLIEQDNFQIAIISSGFKTEMVKARAELLGIQRCYIGRDPKIDILKSFCAELSIEMENVALIGDDVNDLDMIKAIGFSACPGDAVNSVKSQVDVVLSKNGGEGCVREFIDAYLLKQPLA